MITGIDSKYATRGVIESVRYIDSISQEKEIPGIEVIVSDVNIHNQENPSCLKVGIGGSGNLIYRMNKKTAHKYRIHWDGTEKGVERLKVIGKVFDLGYGVIDTNTGKNILKKVRSLDKTV